MYKGKPGGPVQPPILKELQRQKAKKEAMMKPEVRTEASVPSREVRKAPQTTYDPYAAFHNLFKPLYVN